MRATETYNDQIVRLFLLAAAVWGIVGMAIGVYAAAEMVWPSLNFGVPWLTFSRIRPRPYVRRHLRVRRIGADGNLLLHRPANRPHAARIRRACELHLLGVAARMHPGDGDDAARHHAKQGIREPEWFIDIAMALVWVSFGAVFSRDDRAQAHPPHLCLQLVLRRPHHRRGPVTLFAPQIVAAAPWLHSLDALPVRGQRTLRT